MYESLMRIYKKTHNVKYLDNAIKKGWITKEQKKEIIHAVDGE